VSTAGPEFRFDPLTREWVNIVGHRQGRPNLPAADCPFCVGGLEAPDPYDVRWFTNRWAALTPGAPVDLLGAEAVGTTSVAAVGTCEVVLFSPDHHQSLAGLGAAGVRHVVDMWAGRTSALLAQPEIEYVLVFENRGREVGATIDHPHGQIYGYPFVPSVPAQEASVAREHGCPVCAETRAEATDPRRVVYDDGEWMAWVPYASGYAYGLRIAPRSHRPSLPALATRDRDALSALLTDVLSRYDRLWPPPHPGYLFPYLLWFHQAPAAGGDEWHLHAHTAPPLRAPGVPRFVASGELGSGTLSNPVVPEAAAAALRNA
jgi:UDPglucose--hexose-1-phosphate uridylyltransferase